MGKYFTRFTAANVKNGYAAMVNAIGRPKYPRAKTRTTAEAIAREKTQAARMAKINAGKKKK